MDGCTEGPVEGLDDGIECTVDLCDEQEGISHIPSDALCSTGAPCNADYCDVSTGGCAPAVLPDCCGNGFVELDEECDDGNQVEGDGCKPSCQVEDECPIWTKTYTAEGSDQPTAIVYLGAPGYAFAGTTSGEGNDSFGFLTFINTKGSFINTILYGLGGTNALHDLIVTEDGGFAMAGSSNASFTGTEDFYLVRAYANGVFAWSRTIGGDLVETARALIQTEDGGFALAGQTHSFGEGGADAWLVRNEPNGDLIWANAYGGSEDDFAWDLVQTQGQEFTVVGSTHSAGGNQDGYLFHTLSDGTLLWEKKFDLGADESLNAMVHTPNEDYILAGTTTINGETDLYVVRTDDVGAVIWEDVIETPGVEETVSDIQLAEDGGLLISGSQTLSDNTTMPWATRMTPTGEVVWDMAFANAAGAQGRELAAIPGGGFVLLAGQNTPESDPISLLKGNAWGHTSCPEAGVCETISFADCDDGLSCNDVSICDPTEGCTPVNPLFNCCGNGDLDPGEECDDSNLVNGDGCSSECLLETEP